jgi:hypothetical protein
MPGRPSLDGARGLSDQCQTKAPQGEKARRTERGLNARVGRGFQAYADLRGKPRRGLSVQKHLQARSGNASALPGEKRGAAWKQMVVEAFSATPL